MAEVSYKSEPTVSVHGVPQSQYDTQMAQGQQPGGGLIGNIKQHWAVWMVGIGLATIAIIYLVYRAQSNSTVNNPTTDTTSGTSGSSTPDQLWGSQLDADYQQLISSLNTNTGLLQSIVSGLQTIPTSTPPPTNFGPCPPGMHLCKDPAAAAKFMCCGGTGKKPTRYSPPGWTPPKTASTNPPSDYTATRHITLMPNRGGVGPLWRELFPFEGIMDQKIPGSGAQNYNYGSNFSIGEHTYPKGPYARPWPRFTASAFNQHPVE